MWIDAELTQRSVSAQMVQTLHGGNKEAEEMMRYYNPSSFLAGVSFGMELASKIIHNAPTVEAKPVVHCKDCDMLQDCKIAQYLGLDGYCSRGEKHD